MVSLFTCCFVLYVCFCLVLNRDIAFVNAFCFADSFDCELVNSYFVCLFVVFFLFVCFFFFFFFFFFLLDCVRHAYLLFPYHCLFIYLFTSCLFDFCFDGFIWFVCFVR